jgi:hypothetical protein
LILTLSAGSTRAQEKPQDPESKPETGQEETEKESGESAQPEEKTSFFRKMAGSLAEDVSTTPSLIKLTPRPDAPAGSATAGGTGAYGGGEWFAVPIPQSGPTLGTGLAFGVGKIYRLNPDDEVSPPTLTGAGGIGTSNGTWGFGAAHRMNWGKDTFRLNLLGAYGDVNYLFRPEMLEDTRFSIPVNVRGTFFAADFLFRPFERIFIGPRFTTFNSETEAFPDGDSAFTDPPPDLFGLNIDSQTTSLGLEVMRDTRDSLFYPRKGSLASFRATFFEEGLGSDFDYEKYTASFSIFQGIGKHQVIAAIAAACSVTEGSPFFDLCYLGQDKYLRGYRLGWNQNRTMFSTQAEYRVDLFWRIGLVGFAGVGQVARSFGKFNKEDWLPGVGFGIRFTIAKENRVNFRIDFAWGSDSSATYINGGEAF